MSSAMETFVRQSPESARQEGSIHSPDTRSHSGSDEEPMPMTPSSGMGRHQGTLAQLEPKRSEQTEDVEMADETGRGIRQSSTRVTSPLSTPEPGMSAMEEQEYEEGLDEEAAQYTQPAEL